MASAVASSPLLGDGLHLERPDGLGDRRLDALRQPLLAELVHQEADGAAVHAVDALARAHGLAQRLQQETVAAQRHHHVGFGDAVLAVDRRHPRRRLAGVFGLGGNEGVGRVRVSASVPAGGRFRREAIIG